MNLDATQLLNAAIGILLSGALYMLKNIQARLTGQDKLLASIAKDVTVVQTVLMGPTGENGLRFDVRTNTEAIKDMTGRLDRSGASL